MPPSAPERISPGGTRRGILAAIALLGGSTAVTTLAGVAAAKLRAEWLLTAGFGLYSLEAALLSFVALFAGAGIGVSLVRLGSGVSTRRLWALRRAARRLALGIGAACGVVLALLPQTWLERWVHFPLREWEVLLLAVSVVITVLAGLQASILSALPDLRGLARATVVGAVAGGAVNVSLIWLWRERGVAPALLAQALMLLLAQAYALRRHRAPAGAGAEPGEIAQDCRTLLGMGVPYMFSMLAGGGVLMLLPYLAADQLGLPGAGLYRAAARIGTAYMTLLAAALAQDYLPRVSRAVGDPEQLRSLINDQHWILMLLAIPAVLAGMAVLPGMLGWLYTPAFAAAGELLRWQLSGDLLRFSCWSYSYVLLAVCGSGAFLFTEILGGAGALGCTWLGLRWWGLTGAGIGYLASYVWYWGVVWLVLRRRLRVRLTRGNKRMLAAGLAASGVVLALAATPRAQTVAALALLALVGGPALWRLRREWLAPVAGSGAV